MTWCELVTAENRLQSSRRVEPLPPAFYRQDDSDNEDEFEIEDRDVGLIYDRF